MTNGQIDEIMTNGRNIDKLMTNGRNNYKWPAIVWKKVIP